MKTLTTLALAATLHAADWKLARDGAGHVVEADLTSAWVTDADLAKLGDWPTLRKINLAGTRVTDVGFEHLRRLPGVVDLSCYFCDFITEDAVVNLRGWKKLERLNLHGTRVTSKVFEHLAHLEGLRDLDLGFTQIDDEGFEHLTGLTKLERLAIGGNRLNGSSLAVLKLMPALRVLDVAGIQRVDSGLWGLALSPRNLARIGELTGLVELNLAGATINDRGVDRPGHPDAERKELRDLSALAALPHLERLDLSRQPLTREAVLSLKKLPKLKELRLGLVKTVDEETVAALGGVRVLYARPN
ncbi:MAG: hypothetical protein FJW40_00385 [Acidobacteria bacterium]|nr:hypothetical protein [Acidobacteriota bacterium]